MSSQRVRLLFPENFSSQYLKKGQKLIEVMFAVFALVMKENDDLEDFPKNILFMKQNENRSRYGLRHFVLKIHIANTIRMREIKEMISKEFDLEKMHSTGQSDQGSALRLFVLQCSSRKICKLQGRNFDRLEKPL